MRYWDSSAVVPLLVHERQTPQVQFWLRQDPQVLTWWATGLECVSAISRREREQQIGSAETREALRRLHDFAAAWQEVQPQMAVREVAWRLLRNHPLRTADAMQLAAAVIAAGERPAELEFVCLDERLSVAARREGFPVLMWPS